MAPVTKEAVDRELLRRIYSMKEPTKIGQVDDILSKRKGNQVAMNEMYKFLGEKHKINVTEMRKQVEKDLEKKAATSSPSANTAPAATPGRTTPSAPTGGGGGAAAGGKKGAALGGKVSPTATAGGAKKQPAAGGGGVGGKGTLEEQTVHRLRVVLFKSSPEKAANAENLVATLKSSKEGLTPQSANNLISTLEKRLGYTEAEAQKVWAAAHPSATAAASGGTATSSSVASSPVAAGAGASIASSPSTGSLSGLATAATPAAKAVSGASPVSPNSPSYMSMDASAAAAAAAGGGGGGGAGEEGGSPVSAVANKENSDEVVVTINTGVFAGMQFETSQVSGRPMLKHSLAQLMLDAFGPGVDQRVTDPNKAGGSKRAAMNTEEFIFYEQLLLPSVKMACKTEEDVFLALREIFLRCEYGVLPPSLASQCQTSRDVADRVVRALQTKYELRNPSGKQDFFAKFMPRRSRLEEASATGALKSSNSSSNSSSASGVFQSSSSSSAFVSIDSNPMAVSKQIAQNTLASSMLPSSIFLGGPQAAGGGGGQQQDDNEDALDSTSLVSDLGPLGGVGGTGDPSSFSALLVSAMKFLDSSGNDPNSAEGGGGGGGGLPQSEKEILHAVFALECLDYTDIAKAAVDRRNLFKLAIAQDVADVLGWGELVPMIGSSHTSSATSGASAASGGAGGTTMGSVRDTLMLMNSKNASKNNNNHSGKHTWRNVIVKRFSLSTAGNVHAVCEIVIPAGIAVEDLQSLVFDKIKVGGFPLPRSRVSLSRDLEARPSKLYCKSASFGESEILRESVLPESFMDDSLAPGGGLSMSPHRNQASPALNPTNWPVLPVASK